MRIMKETNKTNKKEVKMSFIRTTDADTAKLLRTCGYTEMTESSSAGYCFLNNGKLMFEEDDEKSEEIKKNMFYTKFQKMSL